MNLRFHFTLEPDWRAAPLAFWAHVPVAGTLKTCSPPAPLPVLHKGFVFLHVEAGGIDLQFSSLAQLDHFIDVMAATPRPTSRQLSLRRAAPVGPNGHWLSRLPATLKAPRARDKLLRRLRAIREAMLPLGDAWHSFAEIDIKGRGRRRRPGKHGAGHGDDGTVRDRMSGEQIDRPARRRAQAQATPNQARATGRRAYQPNARMIR